MKIVSTILTTLHLMLCFGQIGDRDSFVRGEYQKDEFYIQLKENYSLRDDKISEENAHALNQFVEIQVKIQTKEILYLDKEFKILGKKKEALGRVYRVKVQNPKSIDDLIEQFSKLPYIAIAEKIPKYSNFFTPNDPDYSDPLKRWHLDEINAESAWDISLGNSGIKVAIVDDAVLIDHEDLTSVIYQNYGEVPNNGIDDDNNGYIDDWKGFDVADQDSDVNPPSNSSSTYFTHGTIVASISAVSTNNNMGLSSIGNGIQIIPVKCKSSSQTGPSLDNPIQGVEYAIAAGADVINMSWGGGAMSQIHQQLFTTAYDMGIVCVAAAGNSSLPLIAFPANYVHVISVGASDSNNEFATFTNYSTDMDVYAPGVQIWGCKAADNSNYGFSDGTSMSSPLVAGTIGLMLSNNPNLHPADIVSCIKNSAAIYSTMSGLGVIRILDAHEAMQCLPLDTLICESNNCELIPNGDFETASTSGITNFTSLASIWNDEICSWMQFGATTDIFPMNAANYNQHASGMSGNDGFFSYEGVTSEILNLVAGEQYVLTFDLAVSQNMIWSPIQNLYLDSLVIGLVDNSFSHLDPWMNDTLRLATMSDLPVDFRYHSNDSLMLGLILVDTFLSQVSIPFIAPNDPNKKRLFIQPLEYESGIIMRMHIDNISISKSLSINAISSNYNLSAGDCATLTASGDGDYYIWEPATEFVDPIGAIQNVCPDTSLYCLNEQIEYTVLTVDTITGCTISDTVVIQISGVDTISPIPNVINLSSEIYLCGICEYIEPPTAFDNCSGNIIGVPDQSFPISFVGTTVITWTFTDGNGNSSSQTQDIIISLNDTVPPTPVITILPDIVDTCGEVTPIPPLAFDNCESTFISATTSQVFPINVIGNTLITWVFEDGNSNQTFQTQNVIIINDLDNSVVESGGVLTALDTGHTYQWIDCDNGNTSIIGETNITFEPLIEGSYAVQITEGNCMVTSNCVLISKVNIKELQNINIEIYPNPTKGVINILILGTDESFNTQLYNVIGELVSSDLQNEGQLLIEGPPGLYFLKINLENGKSEVFKLLKMH